MSDFCSAGIFPEDDVANPVQAVFDPPVTDPIGQESSRIRAARGQAGDGILHLHGFLPVAKRGAFEAENLLQTRPVQRCG